MYYIKDKYDWGHGFSKFIVRDDYLNEFLSEYDESDRERLEIIKIDPDEDYTEV